MESPERSSESKEYAPDLLFKVTLMRHEKPYYKDEGHDLTPEGVEAARETGRRLREEGVIDEADEIHLVHSPKPRAEGTLGFVAEGAGIDDMPHRSIDQLRSSDTHDFDAFMERINELEADQELVAEDHYTHPMHSEGSDIIEPHENKKRRLYRACEYLIRWFEDHPSETGTPHVIAVSHFEVITHLIDDVFGIENIGRYNAPSFGESVYIEAHKTDDPDEVLLKVTYNGETKEVYFDRKNRSIKFAEVAV
jgi:broad specificity phosphatase PhoE